MKQTILMLFIISALNVSAKSPNEFGIYGEGSYMFFFQPKLIGVHGVSSTGFGGDLGMSFTGFFSEQFGFHVGLDVGMYNVKNTVNNISFCTPDYGYALNPLVEGEKHYYDLYTDLFGYYEKHRMALMSVPLMLQFQTPRRLFYNTEKVFYAATGVKLNYLINSQYDVEVESFRNEAHFKEINNWGGTQEFVEFGRFKGNTSNGQFGYFMPVFTVETGLKWYFPHRFILYTSIFFEYVLNDPTKDDRDDFNNYTSGKDFQNLSLLKFSNNTNLMSAGIKLRLAFVKTKRSHDLPCPKFK
jgi:hypothetical protein